MPPERRTQKIGGRPLKTFTHTQLNVEPSTNHSFTNLNLFGEIYQKGNLPLSRCHLGENGPTMENARLFDDTDRRTLQENRGNAK